MVAGVGGTGSGFLYASTNSGSTWYATTNGPNDWNSVACSMDARTMIATSGQIFLSTNFGTGWQSVGPAHLFKLVTSSADGTRLAAGTVPGSIYTSADAGRHGPPPAPLLGTGNAFSHPPGLIYTAQPRAAPALNVSIAGANLLLSWPFSAPRFVLQRSTSLTAANWADLGLVPTVTGAQNQVALSMGGGPAFYRLRAPIP